MGKQTPQHSLNPAKGTFSEFLSIIMKAEKHPDVCVLSLSHTHTRSLTHIHSHTCIHRPAGTITVTPYQTIGNWAAAERRQYKLWPCFEKMLSLLLRVSQNSRSPLVLLSLPPPREHPAPVPVMSRLESVAKHRFLCPGTTQTPGPGSLPLPSESLFLGRRSPLL